MPGSVAGNGCGEEAAGDGRAWLWENCADGCGRCGCKGVAGNGWGEEAAGDERGCADGCGWEMGSENCADGCGRRGCRGVADISGEKMPLVVSELGCADGCGREMGAEKCADGCGRRGCNGAAGNGWREEAAGDEPTWLR